MLIVAPGLHQPATALHLHLICIFARELRTIEDISTRVDIDDSDSRIHGITRYHRNNTANALEAFQIFFERH